MRDSPFVAFPSPLWGGAEVGVERLVLSSTLSRRLPTPTLPSPQGGGLILLARQRAEDVDHAGDVVAAKTHVEEFLIQRRDAIEDRRRDAELVRHIADHVEIVLQGANRPLHRLEAALR